MVRKLAAAVGITCFWVSAALGGTYDLEIIDLSCPAIVNAGQGIQVSNTVGEVSNTDALTSFTVGIYISTNTVVTPSALNPLTDTYLAERLVSGGLAALASDAAVTGVTIPTGLAPGDYYIVAYADIYNDLPAEQQDTDNDNSDAQAVEILEWTDTPLGGGCAPAGGGGDTGPPGAGPGGWLALWLLALVPLWMAGRRAGVKGAPFGVLLLLLAVVAAGCAGVGYATSTPEGASFLPAGLAAEMPHPAAFPGEPDSTLPPELARLGSRLPAAAPGRDRTSGVGARAGLLTTVGEDTSEYDGSIMFGAFYPGELPDILGFGPVYFEAGIDLAFIDSDSGRSDATLLLFRFDCLFSEWEALSSEPDLYFVGGCQIVDSTAQVSGEGEKDEIASALDVGVGVNWAELGLDARFTWSILLGSDNIGSLFLFTAGYRF